jgi:NAD(P)-dependent dehydrogenase (short-subunit alcohol dehydrogenase family)
MTEGRAVVQQYDYRDRRVIVSGCSSGIGRATAQALVELGAQVYGLDLVAPEIELASFETIDLGDPTSIEAAVQRIGGRVDTLFNCAGVTPMHPPAQIVRVNFLGTRLLTDLVTARMPNGGAVVSTSSNGGYGWRRRLPVLLDFLAADSFNTGLAWFEHHQDEVGAAYSFGKEALTVWSMQQSSSLIHRGIRINTVSPGAVQTPMLEAIETALSPAAIAPTEYPIGRRSSPQEQVGALLFLNGSAASYINGVDLPVDGGYGASLSLTGKLWN